MQRQLEVVMAVATCWALTNAAMLEWEYWSYLRRPGDSWIKETSPLVTRLWETADLETQFRVTIVASYLLTALLSTVLRRLAGRILNLYDCIAAVCGLCRIVTLVCSPPLKLN